MLSGIEDILSNRRKISPEAWASCCWEVWLCFQTCCPIYTLWLQVFWEEGWDLGVLFSNGQRGQSSWSLGTKERVAGFLSGGEVFINPFHEPVVPSGLIPISEVQMSFNFFFVVCSITYLGLTLCNPMACSTPGLLVPHHLPKFANSSPLHRWCHPAISFSDALVSICPQSFPTQGLFLRVGHLHDSRWLNYWSCIIFQLIPSNKYSEFISLKIDWFDLLSVQATFRSLSSTTVWRHQFFGILLLYGPAFTTVYDHWNNHSLDCMDLVGRVISLLFSMLSRFVIAFLPKKNHLLISWLQSSSAVILEPKKRKSVTTSTFSPSIFHEVMWLDAMILISFFDILF